MLLKKFSLTNGRWQFATINDKDRTDDGAEQTVKTSQIPTELFEAIQSVNRICFEIFPEQNIMLRGMSINFDKDGNMKCSLEILIKLCEQYMIMKSQEPFVFKLLPCEQTGNESQNVIDILDRIAVKNSLYMAYLEVQRIVERDWLELFKAPKDDQQLSMSLDEYEDDGVEMTSESLSMSDNFRDDSRGFSTVHMTVNGVSEDVTAFFDGASKKRAKATA